MSSHTIKIIVEVIVAIIIIAAGYYLFTAYNATQNENKEEKTVQDKIAEQADINPIENLPEANPFEANTNPFKGGYKNPFGN